MKSVEVESEAEAAAAAASKALGSLFTLTEVYIWEDGSKYTRLVHDYTLNPNKTVWLYDDDDYDDDDDDTTHNFTSTTQDCSPLSEDEELTMQMNELGLPLSFDTSKKKINQITKSKKRATCKKHSQCYKDTKDEVLDFSQVSEAEILSSVSDSNFRNSLCCMSMLRKSEPSYCGIAVDASKSVCLTTEGGELASSVTIVSSTIDPQIFDGTSYGAHTVMSQDNVDISMSSTNLEAGVSPTSFLKQAGTDNGKNEVGEQLLDCNGSEACSLTYLDEEGEKLYHGNSTNQPKIRETESSNHNTETPDQENLGSSGCDGDFSEWKMHWDSYYERNYFYNSRTNVSTWHPPPGMEHITSADITEKCDEIVDDMTKTDSTCFNTEVADSCGLRYDTDSREGFTSPLTEKAVSKDGDLHVGVVASNIMDKVDIPLDLSITKRKKKARKKLAEQSFSIESEAVLFEGYSATLHKYWCQKYLLFSKFDDGILMDEEGWFSVTPEPIAKHHALRCGNGTIVDCFTGVGGNAIQFAQRGKHVIAIDVDPTKITYAYHNAAIYGVDDQIDFIKGDFFVLAPKLKADVAFLSPPWGGPDYTKVKSYDIKTMLKPHDGYLLFNTAKTIATRIVMFLPKNVNLAQLVDLCLYSCPPWSLEVEKNILNGRLKAITAYFSDTAVREEKSM